MVEKDVLRAHARELLAIIKYFQRVNFKFKCRISQRGGRYELDIWHLPDGPDRIGFLNTKYALFSLYKANKDAYKDVFTKAYHACGAHSRDFVVFLESLLSQEN